MFNESVGDYFSKPPEKLKFANYSWKCWRIYFQTARIILNRPKIRHVWKIRMNLSRGSCRAKGQKKLEWHACRATVKLTRSTLFFQVILHGCKCIVDSLDFMYKNAYAPKWSTDYKVVTVFFIDDISKNYILYFAELIKIKCARFRYFGKISSFMSSWNIFWSTLHFEFRWQI